MWGHPAEVLLDALTGQNVTSEPFRMHFVSIGSMAGANISLPSAALRSSGLEIYGSGGGSVAPKAIFETFPKLWALAAGGGLHIDTEQVPLAEIENAWQRQDGNGRRLVIVP